MEDHSKKEPLLLNKQDFTNYNYTKKKQSILVSSTKWILKVVMWVIFITWITAIFVYPCSFGFDLYKKWLNATQDTVYWREGSTFLLFSAPILLIAFLGAAYLALCDEEELHRGKTSRYARFRLWTFPVLVEGPFGVVSAAEIIGIKVFAVYIIWAFCAETLRNVEVAAFFNLPSKENSVLWLQLTGLRLGLIGLFCLAFLFLPVARGSVLLRLIDIPFEHATRYHVWLGHLTMTIFTLHGFFYVVAWTMNGTLIEGLTEWKNVGIANLPGVISLLAGLLMWVTSLPGVRRKNFELFFYTHQLFIVFVVFLALHVGDFIFCFAAGPIFLFMLDRFLRFWQSRKTVDVVSARTFPCGTVELVLSKPANLHYNALGWIFLQIRELSWLQWHPFSVSSSPLDGKNHLAILIKVLGDWTGKLEKRISSISESEITASVEGPYGHESAYHLSYENLILVAGGIGISPFLAILSDVLHRINDGKPCLPRNLLIVWAVKTSDEIPLLQTVDMESICPNFSDRINLEIQTYVTRESEPPLEEGKAMMPFKPTIFPASKRLGISVLVGTGNIIWSGIYSLRPDFIFPYSILVRPNFIFPSLKWKLSLLLYSLLPILYTLSLLLYSLLLLIYTLLLLLYHYYSYFIYFSLKTRARAHGKMNPGRREYIIVPTIGLAVTVALLDIYYVYPYQVSYLWYKGLLFIMSMVVSVFLFGGIVIGLWHLWERKTSLQEYEVINANETIQEYEPKLHKRSGFEQYINTVLYGKRPNFKGIFESMSGRLGNADIGVIVCGPPTLQTSVAKECRTQNLSRRSNEAIFHFNSHSFDL